MKWSELRRIVVKQGWYLHRNGANHDIYRHDEKDFYVLVGRHSSAEIRPSLYKRLKKDIGF